MGVQINGDTGNISATKADYSGNVTIGGTLTYEDVTNIDSVGLVTARSGIEVGARPGVAASISVDGNMIVSGISTFGGDVQVPDKIIHSGDTNTAIRFPAADTITAETGGSERARIDSSGNFSLGTTSVGTTNGAIGLKFGMKSDNNNAITFETSNATTNRGLLLESRLTSRSGGETFAQMHMTQETGGQGGHIRFYTAANGAATSEISRITSTGAFLIGRTAQPNDINKLVVTGTSPADVFDSTLYLEGSETSGAANTGGALAFGGHDGSGAHRNWCNIYGMKENGTGGNTAAYLSFHTRDNGGSPSERARFPSGGGFCVGATSTTSLGSHTGNANVSTFNQAGITLTQYGVTAGFYYDRINFTNSQYYVVNSSGTGVYIGNGSTGWTAHSDERLKTNITELDGTKAYNHIKTARATSFNWSATGYPTDKKIGFIAQDWETNYPEVINSSTETIDGVENPKGIQYTETVPVLMAALKESITKIEILEAEVAALKSN